MSKIILLLFSLFSLATLANDETIQVDETYDATLEYKTFKDKNINKGNWEFGGSGSFLIPLGIDSTGFPSGNFSLTGTGRYFIFDGFSMGLRAKFDRYGSYKNTELGISSQWYFAEAGKWAFSTGLDVYEKRVKFLNGDEYKAWMAEARVGAHYFINDAVSLNFNLNYLHNLSTGSGGFYNTIGFGVAF